MIIKQCSKCRQWKELSEFVKRNDAKDGYRNECKECRKKQRLKNKDWINKKKRDEYKRNKDSILKRNRNYSNSNALYETHKDKLTIDENVRLHKDGISLEAKCRYCGKYFIPTNLQVKNRIRMLKENAGECSLYCSDGCKESCPIFNKILWPKGFKKSTSREVQPQLRQLVLLRDKYKCQKCGSEDTLHCHHILPINESPIESADVSNCITLCKSCHKLAHKIKGCNYYELRCS